jgi:hypothetical protein
MVLSPVSLPEVCFTCQESPAPGSSPYPTGAVYGRETLQQIAELARKHQLLLLADEIYDKILYDVSMNGEAVHCV